MLLLGALVLAPWMLGFGGWYDNQPYRDILFYTPFVHGLLIGPVVYFYVQHQLDPAFKLRWADTLHFVPSVLWILYHVVMVITDKLLLGCYFFLVNQADPDFDSWYQILTLISTVTYLWLTYRYYLRYQQMIDQMVSFADAVRYRWIRIFLLAYLTFVLLTLIFKILPIIGIDLNYAGSWWYFFLFGLIFYYISIEGFANIKSEKLDLALPVLPTFEEIQPTEPTKTQPIEELEVWKEKLLKAMAGDDGFINPALSLPDLARQLKTNTSVLSKVINQGFGMNFNDFVNEQRVRVVIEKLKAGEQKKHTLLAIAFDCGFNSKATFNRAFKKVTGQSPKDFESSI